MTDIFELLKGNQKIQIMRKKESLFKGLQDHMVQFMQNK